jgi:hypothetical protein
MTMKSEQWNRNYEDVLAFTKAHGYLKLPSNVPEKRRLATWLGLQSRRATIPDSQQENLNFFSPLRDERSRDEKNSEAWYGMYKRLLAFRAANGHDIVTKDDVAWSRRGNKEAN